MKVAYRAPATGVRFPALLQGIRAAGDEPIPHTEPGARVAVCRYWGDAIKLYELGYERVLVCELGFLGDRGKWCHLAWDGLNGRGIHVEGPVRPPPELEPWRVQDGYALILGQVPDDWAVRLALKDRRSYDDWLGETTKMLEEKGYRVRYRKHPEIAALEPLPPRPPPNFLLRGGRREPPPRRFTLREELEGARIAVTLNSTSAIEAVCMGVPMVALDRRGCMAGAVSVWIDGTLSEPPHRRAWVNRLARLQWHLDELADGSAWRALRDILGRRSL